MDPIRELRSLSAAIDQTPIIDNHAHPLLKPNALNEHTLLSIATEANGDALNDSWSSLAHIRATRQLSHMLGCEATWEAVKSNINEQRAKSADAWTHRCMQGIETLLLDDGLDGSDEVQNYSWHDSFVRSKCRRIVRIEAVAADIIRRHVTTSSDVDGMMMEVMEDFGSEIKRSLANPEVVGFKSIICYRGGLDVPRQEDVDVSASRAALESIVGKYATDKVPLPRLDHLPLLHRFVHMTADLIGASSSSHKKPIQFHTGLGDSDIVLSKSSPSHLQAFVKQHPTVPIVLLHAGYPWTREAGYLAAMYPNVYADIGEVFPMISRHGQEHVLEQILELCPWSKILWSTDGHWFPETYVLATIQIRSVLKTVCIPSRFHCLD
jgi:predicted TIM-barrel fold metal-dependent hydrolase